MGGDNFHFFLECILELDLESRWIIEDQTGIQETLLALHQIDALNLLSQCNFVPDMRSDSGMGIVRFMSTVTNVLTQTSGDAICVRLI